MKKLFAALCLLLGITTIAQEKFTVYFDFDIAEVNNTSVKTLDKWISENRNAVIEKVYAYADTVGTNEYNIALSERRAADVVERLYGAGIPITQSTEVKSFGEDFITNSKQSLNRKVEIFYSFVEAPIVTKPDTKKGELSDFRKSVLAAEKGDVLRVPNLNFLNNSDILLPESKPVLRELFNLLKENPNLKIDIQGHICCQPVELDKVSEKRAIAIYRTLIKNGIAAERLSWKSFGSSRPIYPLPEKSEEQRRANRRVEIQVVEN